MCHRARPLLLNQKQKRKTSNMPAVKNTVTDETTLMEFPSGLSVASSLIDRTWTITVGGIVRSGKISEDDDLLGMPKAVSELGVITAEKATDAGEREDSVEIQYWGRCNFDLARFLAYMKGLLPHPDVLPYPPEDVGDDQLVAGAMAVVALSLPGSMGDGVIRAIADKYDIDLSLDGGDPDPDTTPTGDPDWKPEGWDL